MDSKRFIMIKVIERNNNPNDNFINCKRRRQTNIIESESNISQQENLDSIFYSSSSSSSSSENE